MWVGIVFIVLVCSTLSEAIVVRQENSLFGPYQDGAGGHLVWWDLSGNAQLAETVVRLTTDEKNKHGGIWNNYPVMANDWELHMQFHIHGKGIHSNGDGMAAWYVQEPLHTGYVFGSKDYFSGLGVFIDTFEDTIYPHKHKHPYISAVVSNGTLTYDHDEDGTLHQIGGCHVPLRNLEWPARIAISYIENTLTVYFDAEGKETWNMCFRSPGVYLPTGYFFGITASTSLLSDNHDVISVTGLDDIIPGKQWEDRSHIIPMAEHIEIPMKSSQEEEIIAEEEQLQKVEKKREVKREERKETRFERHQHQENVFHQQQQQEKVSHQEPVPTTSFLRKVLYVGGALIILFVAIKTCKKLYAQRKERLQKRLF